MIQLLLSADVQTFIKDNENADVAALALKKPPVSGWPYPVILDQIKARQKAAKKLPYFLEHANIVLPPSDVIEQASAAATADYKATLVSGNTFADLTGGAGADTAALAKNFKNGICIEHNENAAALLKHNLKTLAPNVETRHAKAEDFLQTMPPVDLIYLDPQRRDDTRRGYFRLADCTPDVTALLPALKQKTKTALLKTSPMLDIHQAIIDLQHVSAVHIVEHEGECKEVLYLLDFASTPEQIPFTAVALGKYELTFTREQENASIAPLSLPLKYLYEPGAAFLKSGAFNTIAAEYGVQKLHKHTHLYTSDSLVSGFPGRSFEIVEILPVSKKSLTLEKANLAIRNFPDEVQNLKKKLGLKDGGDDYLFACTDKNEAKILIHCRKSS